MPRVLVMGGPGSVTSRVILRLRAADRKLRTMVDAGANTTPGARASFITADREHVAEKPDAVAGCEFVDDRIRLLE